MTQLDEAGESIWIQSCDIVELQAEALEFFETEKSVLVDRGNSTSFERHVNEIVGAFEHFCPQVLDDHRDEQKSRLRTVSYACARPPRSARTRTGMTTRHTSGT